MALSSRFPDPREYGDLIALGGELSPEFLLDAYSHGIFPWPMEGEDELPWFCPETRALLFFDSLHIPRSLEKARKKSGLTFSIDRAFSDVIRACAETPRPGQPGTWITDEMLASYIELHRQGHAHSAEAWLGDELVGGIYGVDGGGVFAAESMFYRVDSASKLALLHLVEHLKKRGLAWMDIQMMTPHMEKLGALEISRDEFLQLLYETQRLSLDLFPKA